MLGLSLSMASMPVFGMSAVQRAISILRRPDITAHVYLPGANGAAVSGLLSNNHTPSDGSTGYSSVDGAAGLVLDAMGSVGANVIVNGDFANGTTNWAFDASWSISSGGATHSGTVIDYIEPTVGPLVPGKFYKLTADVSGEVYCEASGANIALPVGTAKSHYFKAAYLQLRIWSNVNGASVDNIKCEEITGIHATQATTANKPAVRRGLYNLLTYSNDLSNAAWSKNTTTATTNTVTMYGGTGNSVAASSPAVGTASKAFTVAALVSVESGSLPFRLKNTQLGVIDNFSGEMLATTTPSLFTFTVTNGASAGDGYQSAGIVNSLAAPHSGTLIVSGIGLFNGTLTAAQILAEGGIPLTTTAAASNPSAGRYWWGFDGVNDSLALGSVPFQMSDDHCVIAGLTPAFSVTDGYAVNPANGASTQMVGCLLVTSAGFAKAAWWDDTSLTAITDNVNRVGTSFVASAVKIGNAKRLRVNSVQSGATENTAKGTTTLTGGSIGSYSPSGSNKYIGTIGPVVIIKGTISDSELLTLERWVASLTPNFTATF